MAKNAGTAVVDKPSALRLADLPGAVRGRRGYDQPLEHSTRGSRGLRGGAHVRGGADQVVDAGVVAHEDRAGARWALGPYATMQTQTIGRAASSRGVIDAKPSMVTIEVSGCSYCQAFEGTYAFAEVPGWPPFQPSCTCTASAV